MALPAAGVIAGLAGITGVSWISQNVIGGGDWLRSYFDPKIVTPQFTGVNNSMVSYSLNLYQFRLQPLAPSDNDLKAIDDFFESFGYRVDRMGIPDMRVGNRDNFTYIKTRDAVVKSSVMQAAQQLAAMLNNGCKFWVGEIG